MIVLLVAAVFIYYTEIIPLKVDAVKVIGKCAGLDKYNFVNGIKIEVIKIK